MIHWIERKLNRITPRYARGFVIATVILYVSIITIVIAQFAKTTSGWPLLIVFLSSVVAFHIIGAFTYQYRKAWKSIEYAIEIATLGSIIAAFGDFQSGQRDQRLTEAFELRRTDQAALIYAVNSVITNDCTVLPSRLNVWKPAPEPYEGACDRMKHFLPQLELEFAAEDSIDDISSDDTWGRNMLINEDESEGSWAGLVLAARNFINSSKYVGEIVGAVGPIDKSPLSTILNSRYAEYWYYLLAVALGLRLAKVTVDLHYE